MSVEAALREGALVGGTFRLRHRLGAGGTGVVWRATDESLGRDVAIKLITREDWQTEDMREVFREEARALARVSHPNVVAVHALGEVEFEGHPHVPYYVMQYLPGGTLRAWTDSLGGPPLAIDAALEVLSDIALGIDALHDQGLVHFDLKPSNVLQDVAGRWVVTDLTFRTWAERQRQRGTFVGTPAYAAPERVTGVGSTTDNEQRADVYSLGVMAYELLTGRRPFHARSVAELMSMHVLGVPKAPAEVAEDLPPTFNEPLLAALRKHPDERPDSARAFVHSLERAAGASPARGHLSVGVADDDEDFRALAAAMLSEAFPSVDIREFGDGAGLAEAHAKHAFDLVVVDLQMPGMGGEEVTRRLRMAGGSVGIVIVSGVGGAADWHTLSGLGADAFLLKPLSGEALAAVARRAVNSKVRVGSVSSRPRVDTRPDPTLVAPTDPAGSGTRAGRRL